ncbi:MAG TPA: hypothetical protein VNO22_01090, partial [Planctomycetota bacterium]|nr:hypothetical protein [Planctomycetota bacterium]
MRLLVRAVGLLLSGLALLGASSCDEGDTIIVQSSSTPAVKEAFVGCYDGRIVRIPSDGAPEVFYTFTAPSGTVQSITGLAWHAPSGTLFSVRWVITPIPPPP